jgi:hypothetical protein
MRRHTFALSLAFVWILAGCGTDEGVGPVAEPADAGPGDAGTCPGGGVQKGPWSLRTSASGATLRWESCAEGGNGDVLLESESGGAPRTLTATETPFSISETYAAPLRPEAPLDLAGTVYMHELTLSDLAPATCYRATLAADTSRSARFCTSRGATDTFRFFAWGDTNPGLSPDTAKILSQVLTRAPDFSLHLGDLQYYSSGLESYAYWFDVMQPMFSGGAFFPAIGNHESERPGEFEEYYLRLFGDAEASRYYTYESGGVHFFVLDTEQAFDQLSPQGGWLLQGLAAAQATPGFRFSVIQMHRPFLTCGDADEHSKEREELAPSFAEYGVRLALAGHLHGYERFELDGMTYITAGGGGGLVGDIDENLDRPYCGARLASAAAKHAVVIEVGPSGFTGEAVGPDGAVLDGFSRALP